MYICIGKTNTNTTMEFDSLLNEFKTYFPEIDFSDVTSGYNQVENKIISYGLDKLTAEQWSVILDSKYNDLFQDGTPHYNWNTERSSIFRSLIYENKLQVFKTWNGSWHTVKVYYANLGNVKLELKKEEPISFGNGSYHFNIRIVDEVPEYPTHIVYSLNIADGRVYISDQHLGTLDECTEWASKKGGRCRMVEI